MDGAQFGFFFSLTGSAWFLSDQHVKSIWQNCGSVDTVSHWAFVFWIWLMHYLKGKVQFVDDMVCVEMKF